ncbi:MAG TPA: glutathione S-transferase family protein [Alphaproteobacteria bacterium]|nr:glutathione S-transferase family protein [Alphaproteobacteria bacterium]
MILVGRYLSPFVRRTAVVLELLELPYEHRQLSTADQMEEIKSFNPVGRVPALQLDDGEVLVDSGAIIDHLNEIAPADRKVVPAEGRARRDVLYLTAIGHGAMEKGVYAFYERTRRPEDKVFEPWLHHLGGQVRGGLEALEEAAAGRRWLVGDAITLADITATCALDFLNVFTPEMLAGLELTALQALADRCNALPAFSKTRPQA